MTSPVSLRNSGFPAVDGFIGRLANSSELYHLSKVWHGDKESECSDIAT